MTVEQKQASDVFRSILDAVTGGTPVADALQLALEEICGLLALDVGWIYLLNEETAEPSLAAVRQMPPMFDAQPDRWEGLCGCVHALLNRDESLSDTPELYRCSRLWGVEDDNPGRLKYHVCIPLLLGERPIGIINVARSDWRPVGPAQAALLETLGKLLALAVDRDRLLHTKSEDIVRAERERIARELHDTLMQGLTGITLQLETADALLDGQSDRARGPLRKALEITHETMAETRAAIDDLGQVSLGSQTLAGVLTRVVNEYAASTSMEVSLELRLDSQHLPRQVETAVVRIMREGLQNVVRHAGAKNVTLTAKRTKDRLSLILVDDGRGFDAANVAASFHGYGLASMRRRVQLLNGRFRLITAPGKGTRVEISIPVGG